MNIPPFRAGQSAHRANRALKQSVAIMDRAQQGAVSWFAEILKRRLFTELGYSSIYQYAAEELGFSATRTGDFKRLAEKLEALPRVAAKVESGELGYTKAREIVKVADPDTEDDWLALAAQQSRRELEGTVKNAKKLAAQKRKSNPDQGQLLPRKDPEAPLASESLRVGFDFTPLQHARFEALMAKIGHQGNKAEMLLDMMEAYLEKSAPRGHRLPTTRSMSTNVRAAPRPRCRTKKNSLDPKPKGSVATPRSTGQATEARAPSHRGSAARFWPATVTAVGVRDATTVGFLRFTTSFPVPGEARTIRPTWLPCVRAAISYGMKMGVT